MSDCNCANGFPSTYPYQNSLCVQPCLPPNNGGAIVNEQYRTLVQYQNGKLLVVPTGGNTQAFLTVPANSGSDDFLVVLRPDGQAGPTRTPRLALPVHNPASGGSYPTPGGFPFLLMQSSGGDWKAVAAPTTGNFQVQTSSGSFVLVDAGTIPGLAAIAASGSTALKGMLTVITEPTSGNFVLSKLRVADHRVVVGDVDDDGNEGFKTLLTTEALEHPLLKVTDTTRLYKVQALDSGGADVSGGLPQAAVTGSGAISDPKRICYSSVNKQFYLAPPTTITSTVVGTNSSATIPALSYTALPGGHGAGSSQTFNYDKVRVDFQGSLDSNAGSYYTTFAVLRDGVVIYEQDNDNNRSFGLVFIDQNVPYGAHTYSIQWKRTGQVGSGTPTGPIIKNSALVVSTYN